MKKPLLTIIIIGALSSLGFAEEKVPPAVQRVLDQVPRIKDGATLGSFLSDAKIEAQAKRIDGVGGHHSYFLTWTIEGSGHWLMWTNSRQVPKRAEDESEREWEERIRLGELVSVAIYFREDTTETLDFERHQCHFPYLSGGEVHTQPEAEQGGTGQPATAPESKPEGGEKPKLEPKPAPR
jgi:hypothetical protein